MSIEVMRYVWKYSKAKGNARLMLLAIADISNDNGDAYPGVDKLSIKCNMSHRSAQLVINDLERANELKVYENVGTKTISGWTNLYRVVLEGIKQGDIRKPNGEIASARIVSAKKERKLIIGVQPVTPRKDMQPVTRHDMQPDSPHEVQPVTPKSPEHSSGDTTVKSANASVTSRFPKSVKSYTIEHIHSYQRLHDAELKALIAAWSDVVMFPTIASFSLKEARAYIEVHKELVRLNKPCGDYLALANHTKKKNVWKTEKGSKLWITDMLDYVTEYKPAPKVEQTNKPMTETEYTLLLIKEQQEKEAALYGWS